MTQDTTQALVTSSMGEALALETFASDAEGGRNLAGLQNAAIDVIDKYCYSFNASDGLVTDLSIKGVQAIAREMAKKGEIISPVDVQIVAEDDDEVRVICTAKREIIRVIDGQVIRVELDRTTRGKRQTKMQEVNVYEGQGDNRRKVGVQLKPDKFWYEKAISKAVRNAMAPLMGGEMRAQVISLWRDAQVAMGKNVRYLPPARPADLQLSSGQKAATTPPPPAARPQQAQPAAAANTKEPANTGEEDAMPMTPALRQQITRKFNEAKTSLSGHDQADMLNRFYGAYPSCKPLQGAPGGLVLGKVNTIGEGKAIMRWLNAAMGIEAPPTDDDSGGLEGSGNDPQAREEMKQATLAGCAHPDDKLVAHPTDADLLVCTDCGQEIKASAFEEDA